MPKRAAAAAAAAASTKGKGKGKGKGKATTATTAASAKAPAFGAAATAAGFEPSQVKLACNALLKHTAAAGKAKKAGGAMQLAGLEDVATVSVIIGLKRSPAETSSGGGEGANARARNKPRRIPVPHSLWAHQEDSPAVCLFTKDPSTAVKESLSKHPVPDMPPLKVISYTKLRKNFATFAQRRELCASYDVFLSDDRILPMLPKKIGKAFFERKKQPVPVRLSHNPEADLSGMLKGVVSQSTYMYLWGPCASVKVGSTAHSARELIDNINAALPAIVEHVPGKWRNVQSIHVKTSDSVALPLFNSLPDDPDMVIKVDGDAPTATKRKRTAAGSKGEGAAAGAAAGAGAAGDESSDDGLSDSDGSDNDSDGAGAGAGAGAADPAASSGGAKQATGKGSGTAKSAGPAKRARVEGGAKAKAKAAPKGKGKGRAR